MVIELLIGKQGQPREAQGAHNTLKDQKEWMLPLPLPRA